MVQPTLERKPRPAKPKTLFNPKPLRPIKKTTPAPTSSSPRPSQDPSAPADASPSQSAPGTPKSPARAGAARRPGAAAAPKPKNEDERGSASLKGPYQEYRLMSSRPNGWLYDVMKFDSRRLVEINDWEKPVKLNRKNTHRSEAGEQPVQQAVAPMIGSDGKHVVGADGKVVMVDALGRPVRSQGQDAVVEVKEEPGKEKEKEKAKEGKEGKDKDKKKRFQKKTRQVFKVPEEVRQLRREEKNQWVMEDAQQKEVWIGNMEEVSKSLTYGMFMPAANDMFMFVPAHRWYKFQKKPNYHVPNLEEAESLIEKLRKRKDATHWTLRQKTEQAAASGSSLVHSATTSLGPGGKRLRTVVNGSGGLFGDDDEDGLDSKRRVKRELGAEGFLDELDYEENPADDEERMEADDNEDEEAKELEERLKREYKTANKLREGYIDESEDEDDDLQLTGAGKNLQKTLKKLEKGGVYDDSDDEKNPYASSEEEEEEEPPQAPTGPAILPPEPQPGARPVSQTPTPAPPGSASKPTANGQTTVAVKAEPITQSRATSPVPGHGGHSVVAKRATSPKMPKPKTGVPSRAGSPLASPSGASAPTSRATSPSAAAGSGPGRGEASAGPSGPLGSSKPLKRKATDDGAGGAPTADGAPRPKKRKAPGELEDRMVIEWLRATPNATTRDCILHFTRFLTDEQKKSKFTALVKEVAQLSGGNLVLRPAYREASAPSPAAG